MIEVHEAVAIVVTLAIWLIGLRITYLALNDQLTLRTFLGLPRHKVPAVVKDAAKLARRHRRVKENAAW